MNYATIKWADVSNGPGVRVSLAALSPAHMKGLSLLGGRAL